MISWKSTNKTADGFALRFVRFQKFDKGFTFGCDMFKQMGLQSGLRKIVINSKARNVYASCGFNSSRVQQKCTALTNSFKSYSYHPPCTSFGCYDKVRKIYKRLPSSDFAEDRHRHIVDRAIEYRADLSSEFIQAYLLKLHMHRAVLIGHDDDKWRAFTQYLLYNQNI